MGSRARAGSPLVGLGVLCVAIPLLRDLLLQRVAPAGSLIAATAYLGVFGACVITMRVAGISTAAVGIQAITLRSLLLGAIAGIMVVAPVWRLPALSIASAGWLVLAVALEEIAFRGVLFAILQRVGGLPLAVGGTAVMFTLAHAGSARWPSLALVALAGLYLGLLRAMSRDLWASGIAHLLMDLVSLP